MKIKRDKNVNIIYEVILKNAIEFVCKVIGENDNNINWVIFKEASLVPDKIKSKFIPCDMYKYGFCIYEKKEIWISEEAIRSWNIGTKKSRYAEKNLMVDVLLDELAHVKTGKDHGDEKYEERLIRYRRCYYVSTNGIK